MASCMAIKHRPVIPHLLARPGTRAQRKEILTWLVAAEATPVRNRHVHVFHTFNALACIVLGHHPSEAQLFELLRKELGDVGVLERGTGVWDVIVEGMLQFSAVAVEMQRCGHGAGVVARGKRRVHIVSPGGLDYIDEIVC